MDGPVESRAQLLALVRGYRISQAIYVVTQLGIPDLLAGGPRETDELARATESHAPSLRRVLLFLAGVGVCDEVGPQRFALPHALHAAVRRSRVQAADFGAEWFSAEELVSPRRLLGSLARTPARRPRCGC